MSLSSAGFTLAGAGLYEPERVVTSDELDSIHGRAPGTSAGFGIAQRRYASADETSSFMAAEAARRAAQEAGWELADVDALIGACGVMEQPIPGTAPLVQRRLGLGESGIPAFDVNATCLSFLPALDHAVAGIALKGWRRVLIFAADIASAALDHGDPEVSAIFGDGAAAVALEAGGPSRILASRLETYGDHSDLCRLEAGGTRLRPHDDLPDFLARSRFHMEGVALFKVTARRFPPFMARLLAEAGLGPDDIGTVIPHQASAPALAHLGRALGGDSGRIVNLFPALGNRIASSLPHCLATARSAGRLSPGSVSLLVGSSAGVSLGGTIIRW
ncbi:MAG TPA: 3-oxoacyl-[acyl-carrier-protein] synthase III C-terminal domain-containing protein [Allosphingosinicella sp.]|nr:3-oxoacyl-[acyl-carrier-protein] synthase III C-terminal domain-containing protein [Allosphingosinicella sp.]